MGSVSEVHNAAQEDNKVGSVDISLTTSTEPEKPSAVASNGNVIGEYGNRMALWNPTIMNVQNS